MLAPSPKPVAYEKIKPFQVEDSQFAADHKLTILGHKTGMGKTLMTLMAWSKWQTERTLILGSKSSMSVWMNQPQRWVDLDPIVRITDQPNVSDDFVQVFKGRQPGIWMMTHDMFRRCMEQTPKLRPEFDNLILEELHRVRNRKTLAYKQMLRLEFDKFIGMSATWATRGAQDLYAALHLVKPRMFPSYWKFVNTFAWVIKDTFGTQIEGVRNKEALRALLSTIFRSRTWKEVGKEFPPTRREVVPLEMTKKQKEMYDELDREWFLQAGNDFVITPTKLALITRLRQLAVCPMLIAPSCGELGSGIEYVLDGVEDDPHTVIFSDFKAVLPIIEEQLRKAGHKNIFTLVGGAEPEEVTRVENEFKRTRGIALVSISFAESFALDTVYKAYMLGWNWDPNKNIQAEGRLRRLDSVLQNPVLVDYIYQEDAWVDRGVLDVVQEKICNVRTIFPGYIEQADRIMIAPSLED